MNLRPLLILPPLVLGVAGFLWMTRGGEPPARSQPEAELAVRVMPLTAAPLVPFAEGYGRVIPAHSWSAVSEVQGRIVSLAEGLAEGSFVEAGDPILQVDRTDYELSVQKTQANIAAAQATLAELDRQEANARRNLEIEQRTLDVAQTEYQRVKSLADRGAGTQAALNTAEKALFAQQNAITNVTNTLALFPAQRASAEATLAVRRAELAEAQRALDKTTITAPFRGRVDVLNVEQDQFVRTGDTLLTLDSADAVEVVGEFAPRAFRAMALTALGRRMPPDMLVDTSRMVALIRQLDIRAEVVLEIAGVTGSYPAEIQRLRGTIDSETGTMGLVVRVDDPYLANGAIARPPLHVGSFVTVRLTAPAVQDVLAVPRTAVHIGDDGQPFVYLMDADGRLERRTVGIGPELGALQVIRDGLSVGETLVLSTPTPPIPGIRLVPVTAPARSG
ncbi:efflux RND transporter periplasmic adaptor subunit [Pseudodonghicola flavimaris]|uniref:Efflux RND transporter periplasmic adaptor subunit n=1 Tax=Pseudodonghicola flavimaris TaxID=3050036 RepID=A0ABT7EXM2_9RHOB|nr:efflux RND transporter periplasmic adaptor subunit [Pseudodonghicola flavimaris]MDK3017094.1 efflux RND transporter periplasmic adaptor subunit [Pseudodonghicola flavimaris]